MDCIFITSEKELSVLPNEVSYDYHVIPLLPTFFLPEKAIPFSNNRLTIFSVASNRKGKLKNKIFPSYGLFEIVQIPLF